MARVGHECRRIDAWRLLNDVPAVLLSTMLVTIALNWLAAYTPVVVAAWLLGGPLLVAQGCVERFAVRAFCHFRAPTGRNAACLGRLENRCQQLGAAPAETFDWYVVDDARPNAYAAGRRSIAVTTGLLRQVHAGQLTDDELLAAALHEIGHHATGGVRHGLVIQWLTGPWQTVHRFTFGLGRKLPLSGVSERLMPIILAIAIWQVASSGGSTERVVWEIVVLATVGLAICVRPRVDAAIDRAAERAADAYVAALGMGPALDSARQHMDRPPRTAWPGGDWDGSGDRGRQLTGLNHAARGYKTAQSCLHGQPLGAKAAKHSR